MLDVNDREFLLSVVSAPRRAHNLEAHRMASQMLGVELLDILEAKGTAAQRDLAVKLAALPPLLSGECLACAFSAGKVLLREVELIQNSEKPRTVKPPQLRAG